MASGTVESAVAVRVEENRDNEKSVDREKTCPLLLRVFCAMGRHHSLSDYARGSVPASELQIYTWTDATLLELTGLVREVNYEARRRGTRFSFAQIYPDPRNACYSRRDMGSTISGERGPDDLKTLKQCRFTIGDYIDIAITPPNRNMNNQSNRRFRPY
uniref:18 kDa Sin3-associated polypeptide n=1 Tax=Simocephalus serrulatus TaxID=117539 RepID=A0A4Y7NMW1_9CRUS|nr:EOG090X0HU3 [Simocephalus serrulatus]SVE94601.1 EOG090X0HU3 [Simocephalus serrulatus]